MEWTLKSNKKKLQDWRSEYNNADVIDAEKHKSAL